jgi:hypothetical protein
MEALPLLVQFDHRGADARIESRGIQEGPMRQVMALQIPPAPFDVNAFGCIPKQLLHRDADRGASAAVLGLAASSITRPDLPPVDVHGEGGYPEARRRSGACWRSHGAARSLSRGT